MTVSKILEEVVETICDKHCKFPEQYYEKYGGEMKRKNIYTMSVVTNVY